MAARTDQIELFLLEVSDFQTRTSTLGSEDPLWQGWGERMLWHWRYRRRNGLVLARSEHGYTKRSEAVRMAKYATGWSDGSEVLIVGPLGEDLSNMGPINE